MSERMAGCDSENMFSRVPLVIILGSTGSGKTKLSLNLAKKYGGEIINADSMQVYKGLDIVTAKVTPQEQKQAPHHLLSYVTPGTNYNVVRFQHDALTAISDIQGRSRLPIVVGGTNYYIESILWKTLITAALDDKQTTEELPEEVRQEFSSSTDEELHAKLCEMDATMGQALHPSNRRKVIRCLEVCYQTGQQYSEILKKQHAEEGASSIGGPLRFPGAVVFHIRCNQEQLDERLNSRVDEMVSSGLVEELEKFHDDYNLDRLTENRDCDYTHSIFQSIGFKEFHSYLTLGKPERATPSGKALLEICTHNLKLVTRRYARRQLKWVRHRLLCQGREVPDVWPVDSTDPAKWEENVERVAYAVLDARLKGENPPDDIVVPLPRTTTVAPPLTERNSFYCDACERLIEGAHTEVHLKSAKHSKAVSRKKLLSMVNPKEEPVASVGPDFENSWSKSPTWSDKGWGSDDDEDLMESRRGDESSDNAGVSPQSDEKLNG